MGPRITVSRVGKYGLSEGGRLLWLVMSEQGLSQDALRLRIGASVGQVGKWLRGDARPSGSARAAMFSMFRIDPGAWDLAPRIPFSLSGHAA